MGRESKKEEICVYMGFPGGSTGTESDCNVRDLGSIPGLGRFPWRRERLPTAVFWHVEFHGLYSPWGHKESDMTELLSLHRTLINQIFHRCYRQTCYRSLGNKDPCRLVISKKV